MSNEEMVREEVAKINQTREMNARSAIQSNLQAIAQRQASIKAIEAEIENFRKLIASVTFTEATVEGLLGSKSA